ncbi:dipeptidyl aminopeptidase/acylaminoacyl peptidase [Novosphingobium chloroacetimidivorans]|uniref:Dipeptidyl aminopeptidase/acylaminoacyl peptidase n=2 Tax=Novosphingobium chloroacetimidivorans TaxID=1428314 RepID=A0A7W7KCB5_9SPHN|nr:dipeptidyl aminopeptidase/acylaminoacyl peptidase [Novosphingobium chloroacetimidivorans]
MRRSQALLLAASAIIMVPLATAQAQETASATQQAATPAGTNRSFSGSDLFGLVGATDPQISPDGSRVAYVRMTADVMTDKEVPTIWLVDLASGRQTPLVAGKGSHRSPRWSPDGRRLAYVSSDGEGAAQLYVMWVDTDRSVKVTGLPDSPGSLAWSPDGRSIAYTMRVPGEGLKLGEAPEKPEGAKWADELEVIDRVAYRADGGGYAKPGFDHVFVVPAEGGAPRQVTFGDYDDAGPLSWSPDGARIVFSGNRRPEWQREANNSEVYAVDVASGAVTALTSRQGPDGEAMVSPDGKHVAYLGFDDVNRSYENTELYVMNADGTGVRPLTAGLDRSIETVRWVGNSQLYVSYDDHGKKRVARVGLDGSVRLVADGLTGGSHYDRPYTGGEFSVSNGGKVAYTAGGTDAPADVYVEGRRLTNLNANWKSAKALAPVRKLPVTAPDGRAIDAWLVTPPGLQPGQRVPLILEIHGGPNSAYGPAFSTDNQLYAAHGYAVLYTNPRGSTSYGEEFANLIDRAYPGTDYDDLMAAVDAAIADGVADPNNLFVTGGSGGGVLTAWIVGKTDRFKAAASQKPVINWISEALTMDATTFTSRYWFDKKPWEDPMSYWSRSPLSLVGNVKTPTLVVVGSEDYRTPVSESEQYYAALQIKGVPTALVKVPGASHGGLTARPSQSAAKAAAILAWFDRYRVK